jgi:hypothetical protein
LLIEHDHQNASHTVDLDDIFNDIYYMDFLNPDGSVKQDALPEPEVITSTTSKSVEKKRSAKDADLDNSHNDEEDSKELTEAQKLERRERNREHAKRSRLRKKFLLESLQEQIHELEEQITGLKDAIKAEIPNRAEAIIKTVCGDKEKYTPLPMPSGFGPVKTLMEPDFRLSKCIP